MHITTTLATAFLVLGTACAAVAPAPQDFLGLEPVGRGEVAATIGARSVDEDDWGRFEDQFVLGIDFIWEPPNAWLELEAGMAFSYDEDDIDVGGFSSEVDVGSFEAGVGIRRSVFFHDLRLRAYAGAGGSFIYTEVDGRSDPSFEPDFRGEDTVFGGYAKAGVTYALGPASHIGVEWRGWGGDDYEFGGRSVDASYSQIALVFSALF